METWLVYSFCSLKECMLYLHIQTPKNPYFVYLSDCYGIGGKYFKH